MSRTPNDFAEIQSEIENLVSEIESIDQEADELI